MKVYSGQQKLAFCKRLGKTWHDLADYFDILADEQQGFAPGDEPRALWTWLENRNRLDELPRALADPYVNRADIVADIFPPSLAREPKPGTRTGPGSRLARLALSGITALYRRRGADLFRPRL